MFDNDVSAELAFVPAVFAADCAVAAFDTPVLAVDCADAAFVSALDALVLAVFAVDVTPDAAVFTSDVECPVVVPPVNACHKLSRVLLASVFTDDRKVPNAVAVACPAAVSMFDSDVSAELALVPAVFAADCAVAAFDTPVLAVDCADAALVSAELALVLAVLAVDAVPAAAVLTVDGVFPVVVPPVSPCQIASSVLFASVFTVDRKVPNAVAVDWPAALSMFPIDVRADDAEVDAVFAVDTAVAAFVAAVFALEAVDAAAVWTSAAVLPVTLVP